MAIAFNADEIFQMAEQIEKNGARFYRKAASSNPSAAGLLETLAAMEDKHLQIFQDLHGSVSARESEPTAFDPESEAGLYLQALAGGYVFDVKKDPSELLSGKETLAQVLKFAISIEKNSIVFYLGMKGMVSKKSGQDKLEWIIQEEMKHVRILSDELRKTG